MDRKHPWQKPINKNNAVFEWSPPSQTFRNISDVPPDTLPGHSVYFNVTFFDCALHTSDILPGILSDIHSDHLCSILSDIYSDSLSGVWSGLLSGILSGIRSHILSAMLSGNQPGIYSDILWVHFINISWLSIWHSVFFYLAFYLRIYFSILSNIYSDLSYGIILVSTGAFYLTCILTFWSFCLALYLTYIIFYYSGILSGIPSGIYSAIFFSMCSACPAWPEARSGARVRACLDCRGACRGEITPLELALAVRSRSDRRCEKGVAE